MTPRRSYLLSINTLASSKAEIKSLYNMNLSYIEQNHSSMTRFLYKHTRLISPSELVPKLIMDVTVCIAVNGEKIESHAMTLTLV